VAITSTLGISAGEIVASLKITARANHGISGNNIDNFAISYRIKVLTTGMYKE